MKAPNAYLSKREQQIMEVLYRHDQLTANEILAQMPYTVHNSTIRTQLRILEQKGHVAHRTIGGKFVFFPTHDRTVAQQAALQAVVDNLFKGSSTLAALMLLASDDSKISEDDSKHLRAVLDKRS